MLCVLQVVLPILLSSGALHNTASNSLTMASTSVGLFEIVSKQEGSHGIYY